ncbi:carbohydrate kinase family protein [Paracoccus jiaweipingae]|uniref:carbohydrate kinase family protein n=1 Tax=unclassified Paracoccus (in: a-proteobacteria) TaxID=2688777 RepID=UPI0037A516CB
MILCAGEALIDMVAQDGLFRPLPGGAVCNTAVALGRLGVPTGYLWPVSTDEFGAMLLDWLAGAGVDTTLCPRPDRPTTLAFVSLSGGDARYRFYDEGSAGRLFAPRDLPDPLPADAQALFIGGISLVPDPCGATIGELAARARPQMPVVIDPNIRPFFIPDRTAFLARLDRLFALADLVKLSGDDLDWICPGTAPGDAIARILSRGPRAVFLTGGARGAQLYTAQGVTQAPAHPAHVADTIGAGDSFNAGLLAGLARDGLLSREGLAGLDHDRLARAMDLGLRAAAVTVSRCGANPPWASELGL